ncbi:4'-phosphopantetheinyl transferase [Rhodovastum atsumiense]|uniref:4'-phosphopantetheinyl transferase superfamily protein n=1 Tax=Rhodovastum atsumiense TaxID=504468 RepID=A0A5M6ITY2_9PROT|nr:4'-phosphopantetheinyl transferase superfamily protein [Rhodovastum atsumiense]KAA5611389.1 4'-phosphopantetheinyl transferase superfamily protein [Rhodovastum atsumiense]CAH2603602.1 4'-phosphopantetheinyl transferase [Rhodovastum atsumiense]
MSAHGNVGNEPDVLQAAPRVHVWTMSTAGLDEAAVAPWRASLDAAERARADRFAFPAGRVTYIAAHALARAALAGAAGVPPSAFAFLADRHGKPSAWIGGRPVAVSFNLSHTTGLVGIALAPVAGLALGFDLEPRARRAPLEVARRFFTATEAEWLEALPEAEQGEGFFRLWTLKEAFVKATGKGLTQDLSSFWFRVHPPAIAFAPDLPERDSDWQFEQAVVEGAFVAALGLRRPAGGAVPVVWHGVAPGGFDPAVPLRA